MDWLQFETRSGLSEPQAVEDLLVELGAAATWLHDAGDNPVLEPAPGETPLWPVCIVTGLFAADDPNSKLMSVLQTRTPDIEWRMRHVADQDWHAAWQQSLEPIHIGGRLWILPDSELPRPEQPWLELEPGLAFGTGQHPTTALCLEWLAQQALEDTSVLDFGCGSGVLAIAALKLGAVAATAVDIDPQAVTATHSNGLKNGCGSALEVLLPEDIDRNSQYDLLVANILSGTLIEQGQVLNTVLKPGARLALAGILNHQGPDVIDAWSSWATLRAFSVRDEWVLLSGHKN